MKFLIPAACLLCTLGAIVLFPAKPFAEDFRPASGSVISSKDVEQQEEPITKLLNCGQGITAQERLAYIALCEKAAIQYSKSSQNSRLFQRIGDAYYELDMLHYATKWEKWYGRAISLEPGLKKETPIGYRLQEYARIAFCRNLIYISYSGYLLIGLILLFRIIRNLRSFDMRFFIKKTAIFMMLYAALSVVVLALDLFSLRQTINSISTEQLKENPTHFPGAIISPVAGVVAPLFPLGIINSPKIYIVFILGLLPVLMAVFYSSFQKAYNRWRLSTGIIIFSLSLWLNFIVISGTDELYNSNMILVKSRILFLGKEPEKLLIVNPTKALRANPAMLETKNSDLEIFIKKNFPQGFPNNHQ
jgi:hypothetical protein